MKPKHIKQINKIVDQIVKCNDRYYSERLRLLYAIDTIINEYVQDQLKRV